ncbi:MAG: hypothetical protein Q9187_009451 [Circinaria calcarea]
MDAWKSPKRFISDMMDSIELVVIKLPAARKYELLDDDSGATLTDTTSQSSSEFPLRNPRPDQSWWGTRISVIMPPDSDVRDHLALERTFLAHFHTSVALIEVSVFISQWYVLLEASTPGTPNNSGLRGVGTTLSCALITWAMVVNIIGALRFFRVQNRILKGRSVVVGSWDLKLEGLGVFAVNKDWQMISARYDS